MRQQVRVGLPSAGWVRPLLSVAWIEVVRVRQFRSALALDLLFSAVNAGLELLLLQVFVAGRGDPGLWGMTVVYALVANAALTVSSLQRVPAFSEAIADGGFVRYSIRPLAHTPQFLAAELGQNVAMAPVAFPLLLVAFSCARHYGLSLALIPFLVTQAVGLVLAVLICNVFYSLTQVTQRNSGPRALLEGTSSFLAGAVVPLVLWPSSLHFLANQPFALVIDAPIEVLLGRQSVTGTLVRQAVWILVLGWVDLTACERLLSNQRPVGG